VSRLPLFQDGQWRDEVQVELFGFDAGTDGGTTYRSADEESQPHVPVARLSGYPVANGGTVSPFATFTFRRLQ
jgi:hypothetical protein